MPPVFIDDLPDTWIDEDGLVHFRYEILGERQEAVWPISRHMEFIQTELRRCVEWQRARADEYRAELRVVGEH